MKSIFTSESHDVYQTVTGSVVVHDRYPNSAVVLALHKGHMVVIRQYREGIGTYAYELPGGAVEPAEDPLEAAQRELLEETGLFARDLTPLATIQSCGHLTNETAHLFFAAETVIQAPQHLDADEAIQVSLHTIPDALHQIVVGTWKNRELAHAVLLALLHGHIRRSGLD